MFAGVNEKLECAGYLLNNLKTLAEDAGGLHNLKLNKQHEMRANLDGFFFEVISAKDFFLQGINDHYGLGLPKDDATKIPELKCALSNMSVPQNVSEVVKSVEKRLSRRNSWLWRLNNYRNSATHRELLHYWNITEGPTFLVREGEKPQFQIVLDSETKNPTHVRRVDIVSEDYAFKDTKMYLFADPEDSAKGKANMEIIPYCEQSLAQMKELLERLYSELELE